VTRSEIDELRGVDSGGVLRTLLEKRMVQVKGRAKVLGRPLLYETTPEFLKHFGLSDLSELPRDSELAREWGELQAKDLNETETEGPTLLDNEMSDEPIPDNNQTGNGHHPVEVSEAGIEKETDS
jgi:segregation and condensation protein B